MLQTLSDVKSVLLLITLAAILAFCPGGAGLHGSAYQATMADHTG